VDCAIQGEIGCLISKWKERAARGQFESTRDGRFIEALKSQHDFLNCTTRGPLAV